MNVPGLSSETVALLIKRVQRRMRLNAGTREAWFVNANGDSVVIRFDAVEATASWRYAQRPEFVENVRDFRAEVRAKMKESKRA